MAGLVVKPRSRMLHGHDWVYSSEVLKVWGGPVDGDVIAVKDGKDRLLGSAIYNAKSQIIARRFSRQKPDLDAEFFHRRISQAVQYRARRGMNADAARLVWSESDGLPGLIVDRYGSNVVFQTLTLAMDLRRDLIIAALQSVLQPATIIERNDAPIRKAEGLESRVEVVAGSAPGPFWQKIGGIDFELDLLRGQKTGFYLDQVDSYAGVAAHAQGRSVLDCFANQGAFALSCAKAGAAHVQAVEISADACAQIRRNAEHNQLKVTVAEQNVFDFLKLADTAALNTGDSARYDLI